MKNLYTYFIKKPILSILLIIIVPFIINIIVSINNPFLSIRGDEDSWISFFGNYFGALIGGFTALIISRIENAESKTILERQIKEQREKEIRREKIAQYYSLTLIKISLESYKDCVLFLKNLYYADPNKDEFSFFIRNEIVQALNNNWKNIEKIANQTDVKLYSTLNQKNMLTSDNGYKIIDYVNVYNDLGQELPYFLVNISLPYEMKWNLYEKLSEVTNLKLKNKLLSIIEKVISYHTTFDESFESKRMKVASKELDFNKSVNKPQKNKKDFELINDYNRLHIDFATSVIKRSVIVKEILYGNLLNELEESINSIIYELMYTDNVISKSDFE